MRIVLESVLRNCDGKKVTPEHVVELASWKPNAPRIDEIPFVVARVVLQDFTGVPLLADLAAMRNVADEMGKNPKTIEPLVPVDLVVDHSVMIDHFGTKNALDLNMKLEFQRNRERYQFMKWGMQAFDTFGVVPPGFGIVHQVNLEYLARGVHKTGGEGRAVYYPDSLVGTDSHTTMINGIGVVGWGVGGIEAEAGMLGQPVYFLTPDVVGFEFTGRLREGVTATDLVLTVTEILRKREGGRQVRRVLRRRHRAASPLPDRATIGQHGARVRRDDGLLPGRRQDDRVLRGHRPHARRDRGLRGLLQGAGPVRHAARRARSTTRKVVTLDLGTVAPSLAGPKRPQDRIELGNVKKQFTSLFSKPPAENGFNQPAAQLLTRHLVRAAGRAQRRRRRREDAAHALGAAGRAALRRGDGRQQADARRRAARGRAGDPGARRHDDRQRRRADRRDHLVHQHLEPERAARRRPAREEGGRGRPEGQAAHQDLARAGLAHRHRVPRRRPACCPTSRSSASASPPTAAPPASATPAT